MQTVVWGRPLCYRLKCDTRITAASNVTCDALKISIVRYHNYVSERFPEPMTNNLKNFMPSFNGCFPNKYHHIKK